MVKLVPLPKETFTPLVAVIKARKCPAKEEKPGGKKQIIKKASERKLLKLGTKFHLGLAHWQ